MSAHHGFDLLVFAYLDGEATAQQVMALRDALRRQPELRSRLAALVRLHRAQATVLGRPRPSAAADAVRWLRGFADRAGRCLAHASVLALVCVELDVAVPGIDNRSWLEPEPACAHDAGISLSDAGESVAPQTGAEDESAPSADTREADFLDS